MFGVGHVGRQMIANRHSAPGVTLDVSFMNAGTLPPNVVFTRASVGTYFDAAGVMQTASTNTPRWDYDPVAHTLSGLLIEEARTNLFLNSAILITQSVTTTAVATTLSFQGTGTVTLSGTSAAGPLTGTSPTNRVALTFTPTAGTLTCTVSGSVTNAQIEAGPYGTSYVPTVGASVTRATEACSLATGAWFNASTSSLAVEYMIGSKPTPAPLRDVLNLSDGSLANRLTLRAVNANAGPALVGGAVANVSAFTVGLGPSNVGAPSKLATAYNGTTVTGSLNGRSVPSQTLGMPAGLTILTFGYDIVGTAGYINGWIRRVRYWPRALTAGELQSVTM